MDILCRKTAALVERFRIILLFACLIELSFITVSVLGSLSAPNGLEIVNVLNRTITVAFYFTRLRNVVGTDDNMKIHNIDQKTKANLMEISNSQVDKML